MEVKQEKQKNTGLRLLIVICLIITIIASSIGLYAWAKYTSSKAGEATAQVAKWHFELKDGDEESTDEIKFPITRTDGNNTVATGKLAPGTSGKFDMIIDATGTETFLEYELKIALQNKPTNLKFYLDEQKLKELEVDKDNKMTVTGFMSFDREMKRTETIYWDWPYETEGENGNTTENDTKDTQDAGKEMTMQITATGTEVLKPTIVQGEYLDLGKDLVGTKSTADDWRIFYEDEEEGKVYAILADYLPNTNEAVTSAGLTAGSRTYGINSNSTSREEFIKKLEDTEDWKKLLPEGLQSNEDITVTGTVDIETWVDSWNDNPNSRTHLYTSCDVDGTKCEGYCIGTSNNLSNCYSCKVSSDPEYHDTLYFPHTQICKGCYGYWLASPSADLSDRVLGVDYDGNVNPHYFGSTGFGVLPAVCLPSDILQKEGNTWKVMPE